MSPLFMIELAVISVLSIAALVLAGSMVARPTHRAYEILRPVTWAMVFGSLFMTLTGMANMCVMMSRRPISPEYVQLAFAGLAELIIPVMLTFGVLTVAWGLTAIGLRRLE